MIAAFFRAVAALSIPSQFIVLLSLGAVLGLLVAIPVVAVERRIRRRAK